MATDCYCPADAPIRCSPTDALHDARGRRLCCPYDEIRMAAFYSVPPSRWIPTTGRRAAMRKRRQGTLEEIAQRAADTRHSVHVPVGWRTVPTAPDAKLAP